MHIILPTYQFSEWTNVNQSTIIGPTKCRAISSSLIISRSKQKSHVAGNLIRKVFVLPFLNLREINYLPAIRRIYSKR